MAIDEQLNGEEAIIRFGLRTTPARRPSLARAQALYAESCAICHGAQGDGIPGIDLGHGKFRRASSDDDIANIIRTGIPNTPMPPSSMTEEQAGNAIARRARPRSAARSTPAR